MAKSTFSGPVVSNNGFIQAGANNIVELTANTTLTFNDHAGRIMEINDADGVMFVSMGYEFIKKTVPFTAGVRAFVRIKLWNKEGKKVFAINEYGISKKSVGIVGGIPLMKPEKLLPLCESASEKLVSDLSKKIGKVSKKAAKKL